MEPLPKRILFILSTPRSGSTLLRVMLAGHPNLFSPPELHLLPFDTLAKRQVIFSKPRVILHGAGLNRAIEELRRTNEMGSTALLHNMKTQGFTIKDVYAELQNLSGDRILVDKSPMYANFLESLHRAESLFSDARYVFLYRHPIAVIDSFMRRELVQFFTFQKRDPFRAGEELWATSNRHFLEFLDLIEEKRKVHIAYESLIREPELNMIKICNLLEIPFHPNLLTPYDGDPMRMTQFDEGLSFPTGDPGFHERQRIEPHLAEEWKRTILPHALNDETRAIAQRLGYDLPVPRD